MDLNEELTFLRFRLRAAISGVKDGTIKDPTKLRPLLEHLRNFLDQTTEHQDHLPNAPSEFLRQNTDLTYQGAEIQETTYRFHVGNRS